MENKITKLEHQMGSLREWIEGLASSGNMSMNMITSLYSLMQRLDIIESQYETKEANKKADKWDLEKRI